MLCTINNDFVTHRELFNTFDRNTALYRHIAYAICLHKQNAEDALQDACVNLLTRKLPQRGTNLVQWVARVVTNAAIDHQRRLHRTPITAELDSVECAVFPDLGDEVSDYLTLVPPEQRKAICLIDVVGFSVQEAAQLLNVAEGTIKSRRHRGKALLADIIEQQEYCAKTA